MTLRRFLTAASLLAAACTTTTTEVKDTDETAVPDTADTDDTDLPVDSDTDLPVFGASFTSGRYIITDLRLAPANCQSCKVDIDGNGTVENAISPLLTSADIVFSAQGAGGFSVREVNDRIAFLLQAEQVIVLMRADHVVPVLTLGVANGERDSADSGLQAQEGELDSGGRPVRSLPGRFIDETEDGLRFTTNGDPAAELSIPLQFDPDEPVVTFTLKRARIFGDIAPAAGDDPETIEGFLAGAFSVNDVLDDFVYPLIDNNVTDTGQAQTLRNLGEGVITNAADIDKATDDPKISGVFSFTAVTADW